MVVVVGSGGGSGGGDGGSDGDGGGGGWPAGPLWHARALLILMWKYKKM